MDDFNKDTDKINTDRGANDPNIDTDTLDINNIDRNTNNSGKSINIADADVNRKADPSISTNLANINEGADLSIDTDKTDADADI